MLFFLSIIISSSDLQKSNVFTGMHSTKKFDSASPSHGGTFNGHYSETRGRLGWWG